MENTNHIIILVGVCGSGKSELGLKVAQRLEIPFFDADKMISSQDQPKFNPSIEMDMGKWLISIEELIKTELNRKGCVISCSILKKDYRKRLTANINHQLDWIFMNDTYENVAQRVTNNVVDNRSLSELKSDFETLEVPKRALFINMNHSEQETVDTILKYLARKYG